MAKTFLLRKEKTRLLFKTPTTGIVVTNGTGDTAGTCVTTRLPHYSLQSKN